MAGAAARVAAGGAHRASLGQWWTPPAVVDLALALAREHVRGGRVCDPACGDGAFVARAIAAGARGVVGVEVDPEPAAAAARAGGGRAEIVVGDLFEPATAARIAAGGAVDVVVGNPPFVRADRVTAAARARIAETLAGGLFAGGLFAGGSEDVAADVGDVAARGDLAAACLLRALELVRDGGRVVMVVSTALLDADYAAPLWRAVAAVGRVRALVAAPAERWFAEAAVNAMIVVVERGAGAGAAVGAEVEVVRLRAPTVDAAARLAAGGAVSDVAEVRRAAGDDPGAWAAALRAPAGWFDVAAGLDEVGALVPLGALARVRRGITTGANDVFYLSRADARAAGIEPAALAPVVRSPFNGSEQPIAIDPRATPLVALVLPPDRAVLRRWPRAAAHVRRHAAAGRRPSLRTRDPWWSLPARPARLFFAKAYGPRFVQRLAPRPVLGDQRVYAIEPREGVDLLALAAVMNSVFTALAIESLGRASMGHGALEHTVADAMRLPVLDVRRADARQRARLTAVLETLAPRPVEHVLRERARADRAALDAAVAALVPGLAEHVAPAWDALCASVKLRDRWLLPAVGP